MTQARRDGHSTEFGIWLREQREIDSKLGYIATNLDFVWANNETGLWMLIEEKRFRIGGLKGYQIDLCQLIHRAAVDDSNYRGFHKIVFERTSPDDGWACLDNGDNMPERTPAWITKSELLAFLRFESPVAWYDTRCIQPMTKATITPTGVFSMAMITPVMPFGRVERGKI